MEAPPRRSRCGSNEHETLAVVWLASAGGVLAAAWVRTGGCPRRSARQADGGRRDAVPRRLVAPPPAGCALSRPLGHAILTRGPELVEVCGRAHPPQLRRQ